MADYESRNVEYVTDRGQTVVITVKYEKLSSPSPAQRFSDGGFGNQDLKSVCVTHPRRSLKPRYVVLKYNNKPFRVVVKTKETFNQLLSNQNLVRYCGECGCK